MTVEELIAELSKRPNEAKVFHLNDDGGLYELRDVKEATATNKEIMEVTGKTFVLMV